MKVEEEKQRKLQRNNFCQIISRVEQAYIKAIALEGLIRKNQWN